MYFKLFKQQNWRKRFFLNEQRNCVVLNRKERSLSVLFCYFTALFRRAFCRLSATMRKNDREVDKP